MLVLSACSGSPSAEGDRTRLGGGGAGTAEGKGNKPGKVQEKAARIARKAERQANGGTAEGTSERAAGKPPTSSTESQINPAFARRTAIVDDPRDDAQKEGVTPAYAEIVKASIIGLGTDFKMTLTLDGDVPDRMPNDTTHMIIAFGLTGTEDSEGYSFGAQCTERGWQAYAGGKDDGDGSFPGTFFVDNNTIEMTVPWDYVMGPRAFEWYAAANWFSQLANQTHYKVDLAPSNGLAKFPQ